MTIFITQHIDFTENLSIEFIKIKPFHLKSSYSRIYSEISHFRNLQNCSPQQYFDKQYQTCKSCDDICNGCTYKNICIDCSRKFISRYDLLQDNSCGKCPSGQKSNDVIGNKCEGCGSSCSCNSKGICESCQNSNEKINDLKNVCERCPIENQYYIDGNYCKRCDESCLNCSGQGKQQCTTCKEDMQLYPDKSCRYNKTNVNKCLENLKLYKKSDKDMFCTKCEEDGFFIDKDECKQCQTNSCKKCIISECQQCYEGKFLKNKIDCVDCNEDGYFKTENNQKIALCEKCIDNCSLCSNNIQCQKCKQNFYLNDQQICDKCNQDGVYIDKTGVLCKKCPADKNCQKCNNDEKCTICKSNFFLLDDDKCIDCKDGYFKQNTKCLRCLENCNNCNDSQTCITCKENFYLFQKNPSQKICIPCNEVGQFINKTLVSPICDLCHNSCSKCSGKSENECLECKSANEFVYSGRCDLCTKEGLFKEDRKCLNCATNCKICSGSTPNQCSECMKDFSFMSDKQCKKCSSQQQMFINNKNECLKCHDSCQECTDEKDTSCQKCLQNFSFDIQDSRKCKNCQENKGYFLKKDSNECIKCHSSCANCKGSQDIECTECIQGFSFLEKKCQKCELDKGYYENEINQCIKCDQSCETCQKSQNNCTKCKAGLSYPSGGVIKTCITCKLEDNKYIKNPLNENICEDCHPNCNKCTGSKINECEKCKNGFSFDPNTRDCSTCNQTESKYVDENNYCQKCDIKCKTCKGKGDDKCIECNSPFYFDDQNICKTCPDQKHYTTDYKWCKKCHNTCRKCNGGNDVDCIECDTELMFDENNKCNICKPENGFYIFEDTNQMKKICKKCHKDCKTCTNGSRTECKDCFDSQFKLNFDSKICEKCEINNGYFVDGVYCKKCHQSCQECENENPLKCKKCVSLPQKLYFRDGLCQLCEEKDGLFISSDNITCVKCHQKCKTCSGDQINQCKTCQGEDKLMQDGTCDSCKINDKFYINGIKCLPCGGNCQTCSGSNEYECLTCPIEKFLLNENNKKNCIDCLASQSFYRDNQNCYRCDPTCLECKNGFKTGCTKCKSSDYLYEDGSCKSDCPKEGYVIKTDTKQCLKCDLSCKECKGKGKFECELCYGENKVFMEGNCDVCSKNDGFYIKDRSCLPCHQSCKTCINSTDKGCTECNENLYKYPDNTCQECDLQKKKYIDKTDRVCKDCNNTCQTCSGGTEFDCDSCIEKKYFYISKNQTQKICKDCLTNNKQFISANNCLDCNENCKTCSGNLETQCIECETNLLIHSDNKCKVCEIELGFYTDGKKCIKCDQTCKKCEKDGCKECIDTLKFKGQICSECKPSDGYFISGLNCIKCNNSCLECNGPTDLDCKRCPNNFLFKKVDENDINSKVRCEICPTNGYFIKNDQCLKCHSTCLTCRESGPKDCIVCASGLNFRNDGSCLICPSEKYYLNKDGVCLACFEDCKTCSGQQSNECIICKDGMNKYSKDNICRDCNKDYFWISNVDKKCYDCDSSCKKCKGTSNEDCTECKPPFLWKGKNCETCPRYRFFESQDNCKPCDSSCERCSGSLNTNCEQCIDQTYFHIEEIIQTKEKVKYCKTCLIKNGFFISGDSCLKCHQTCKSCQDSSENKCLTCYDGKYLYEDGTCQDCGQEGYFKVDDGVNQKLCKKCHNTCKTCLSFGENKCEKCKEKLYKNNFDKCEICKTDDKFFINGDRCDRCDPSCKTCENNSQNKCIECDTGLYKMPNLTCNQCPQKGYFIDGKQCKKCHSSCNECIGEDEKQCKSCAESHQFWSDPSQSNVQYCVKCDQKQQYYIDGLYCKPCHSTCEKCSGSDQSQCKKCKSGKYFKSQNGQGEGLCEECIGSFYIDETKTFCYKCDTTCGTCKGSKSSDCITCTNGLKFNKDKSKCFNCQITNGQYIDTDYCFDCDKSCKTCTRGSDKDCSQCIDDLYFFEEEDKTKIKCKQCPKQKYFIEPINKKECLKCNESCLTCSSSEPYKCIECNTGRTFMPDGTCQICPELSRFVKEGKCEYCDQTCKRCNGEAIKCTECHSDNYFDVLDSNKCKKCDTSQARYIQNQFCKVCNKNCQTCENETENGCLTCVNSLHFIKEKICGECDTSKGFFIEGSEKGKTKCVQCHQSCKECISKESNQCIICKDNLYFRDQLCQECNDKDGFYIEGGKNCISCFSNCKTCSGKEKDNCLECREGKYFVGDTLECSQCNINDGYYIENNKRCYKCEASCKTCQGNLESQCKTCQENLSFYKGLCKKCEIDNGFYVDKKSNQCIQCHDTCQSCSGNGIKDCLQCKGNLKFDKNHECITCPAIGYFIKGDNCIQCHESCMTCDSADATSCTECQNYLFYWPSYKICKTCDQLAGYFIKYKDNSSQNRVLEFKIGGSTNLYSFNNDNFNFKSQSLNDLDVKLLNFQQQSQFKKYQKNEIILFTEQIESNETILHDEIKSDLRILQSTKDANNSDRLTNLMKRQCFPCHVDCKTCRDEQQSSCIICKQTYSFFNEQNICKKCNDDCLTCNGELQTNCIQCRNKDYNIKLDNICGSCLSNQFIENFHCKNCSDNCLKCKNFSKCQTCGNNTQIKQNGKCGICEKNEYIDKATNMCMPCHSDCLSCFGKEDTQCSQCNIAQLRIRKDTSKCGICEINQYDDNIRCYDCHQDCATCIGPGNNIDECMACQDQSKYQCNVGHLNQFAQYYTKQSCQKSCLKCHPNCTQCYGENTNQCMQCNKMILQEDYSCSKKCPLKQFFDDSLPQVKCSDCGFYCTQCINQKQCKVCENEYTLFDGECFKCSLHQYIDI